MKPSSRTRILGILAALALVGIAVGMMMFNKEHTDLTQTSAEVSIEANELYKAFEQDEASANELYVGKLILVHGTIQELTKTEGGGALVVLRDEMEMFGVNCSFLPEEQATIEGLSIDQEVSIKGWCSGSTLAGVDLSRCIADDGSK